MTIKSTLNEDAENESFGFSDIKIVICNDSNGHCVDNTKYTNTLGPFVSDVDNYSRDSWTSNVDKDYTSVWSDD